MGCGRATRTASQRVGRCSSAISGIPVIVITGISHDFKRFIETRRRVPPPAGYFDKPVDAGALLAKVSELLGARVQ